MRRNLNRGYQKLIVWNDAIEYYVLTCEVYKGFAFELKKVASQQISCVDSVHRNIAEGYCRRSIKEYLSFLNISLGSLGESVSGLHGCRKVKQISEDHFEKLDALAYKIENGLLRLVAALEQKRDRGDWVDHLVVKESNAAYGEADPITPSLHCGSPSPSLQYSNTPLLRDSITPAPDPITPSVHPSISPAVSPNTPALQHSSSFSHHSNTDRLAHRN